MAKKPSSDNDAKEDSKKTPKKGNGNGQDSPPQQPIVVNAQYTKDLSFESPAAPDVFAEMQKSPPDINLNINVSANVVQDTTYEIILEMQAECKIGDKIGFILELEYAGLFTLNVPEEHLQGVMLVECPRLLFPFARNILADVSRDGGFPPLMLGPVDFAGMFQASLEEAKKKQDEEKKKDGDG